ncbi:arginase family protein [Asanoa sp. NPDC050611]|uniref:arginase family protein n=1 Tax=Asanoa sp. NPDC050611 TaxID=3157098 RepID=UPI0033D2DD62
MTLRVIGVPSSAGAHAPGVEGGPAHLRRAGLVEALTSAGVSAHDNGDLPPSFFGTPRSPSGARNLPAVAATVHQAASAVAAGEIPVLLGGECTLVLGAARALPPASSTWTATRTSTCPGTAGASSTAAGWPTCSGRATRP